MSGSKTVVIAEDEVAIAKVMQLIVRKNFDFDNIVVAHNGVDAWDAIQNNDVKLVLSDWNMPGLTGYELLCKVRESENFHNLPFIMLTARANKESVVQAVKSRVSGYIHKPFDREALIKKIKQVLDLDNEVVSNQEKSEISIIDEIVNILKANTFSLPMMSNIADKVNALIESDKASIEEISSIILTDASLASRIIAVANSSIYSGSERCESIEIAIKRLGFSEVLNYISIFSNNCVFNNTDSKCKDLYKNIFLHSIAVAQSAKLISSTLGVGNSNSLYTLGLLHDIGKVLVLNILEQITKRRPINDIEKVMGLVESLHEKFGQTLLLRWRYSTRFQEIALYHDSLDKAPELNNELLIVHLANRIARHVGFSLKPEKAEEPLSSLKSTQLLKIQPEQIDTISLNVKLYVSNMQSMLD